MSSEQSGKVPRYMAQLLEELGWNQGTRIPLASPDNQNFETLLIERQNEIQRLKESLIAQNQKRDDLNNYKQHVQSEYQENTRLLFAHKQQLEQEVKLRQLSLNEADRLDRDVVDCNKQTSSISSRTDNVQISIARLLKKADSLKSEVCGERGALQEWRAALERSSGDITAIEQFTKQDLSKAKALEIKRQKLKLEHDQIQEHLNQVVSNLNAEERACERISVQVMEGMEQRKQMMTMWTNAVENLRQRDTDIRHIREDYAVLEAEANNLAEQCREQQSFCDQQRGNNADAQRDCDALAQRLAQLRRAQQHLAEQNACLDSEVQSLQRELSNMRIALEKLHMENRQLFDDQHKRDVALSALNTKIKELKEKVLDSTDKSKCSEKRAKELEDMLNEEERFANQLTVNQQRAMHCSFVEQQKLLVLKNEEKLFHMQLKLLPSGDDRVSSVAHGGRAGRARVFRGARRTGREVEGRPGAARVACGAAGAPRGAPARRHAASGARPAAATRAPRLAAKSLKDVDAERGGRREGGARGPRRVAPPAGGGGAHAPAGGARVARAGRARRRRLHARQAAPAARCGQRLETTQRSLKSFINSTTTITHTETNLLAKAFS